MVSRIALVTSDLFVRRLTPALAAFVQERRDFQIIDVHRPWSELRKIIRQCDPGAIITEVLPTVTEKIVALGYPTVVADTDVMFPGAASIDVDDWEVGATAARFLLESGYRSFGCVYLGTPYGLQRKKGFLEALPKGNGTSAGTRVGGSSPIRYSEYKHAVPASRHYMESWRDRDEGLIEWLKALPKPAGVFAAHDPLGRTVCEVAREAGLLVPDEIAVVGANNDELVCGLSYPPLTSVNIPWDRIGALAGKHAQFLINGAKAPRKPILVQPGAVVVRASTGWGTAVEDDLLRRTLQHMRAQAANGATVDSVCSDLKIDRRKLERKMAEVMQCTPWEMLCRMRVESAKRLLVETDLPMARVAEQAGFGGAERFCVVFGKQVGTTPSAFRKRALGKVSNVN